MRLEVKGMSTASQTFVQLWGRYVTGFDQSTHCQDCLKGKRDPQVNLQMTDKSDYQLSEDDPYYYLFAMGRGNRQFSNVHLAVQPHTGAIASVGSLYGVTFTIHGARAIRVDRLPDGWRGLAKGHASCRNFQFGVQQFGYRTNVPVLGDFSTLPQKDTSPLPDGAKSHYQSWSR